MKNQITSSKIKIEVCANSFDSAIAAQFGGASRIELCAGLIEGGTTPSMATMELVRKHLSIEVNVLIRPRGGDFCYSEGEFLIMKRDIEICKSLQINGVVLGILNPDGTIDIERNRELLELARPMTVTFHRAFDMVKDPFISLNELINLGVDRILTSGLKQTAILGAVLISELVKQADNKLIIMPGSGVKPENIAHLIHKTKAPEFHLSGIKKIPSRMLYQNPEIAMGGVVGVPEYEISVTDSEIIRKVVQIANEF